MSFTPEVYERTSSNFADAWVRWVKQYDGDERGTPAGGSAVEVVIRDGNIHTAYPV
ncbi:hypothetical protein AB0C91_07965 [Streptomyces sp. NPDC048674]|uniref:hypothetical protein n=1 Tax=Streptomyces sp. NPDC048674 TaxID=3155491 RepID=UPI003445E0A6